MYPVSFFAWDALSSFYSCLFVTLESCHLARHIFFRYFHTNFQLSKCQGEQHPLCLCHTSWDFNWQSRGHTNSQGMRLSFRKWFEYVLSPFPPQNIFKFYLKPKYLNHQVILPWLSNIPLLFRALQPALWQWHRWKVFVVKTPTSPSFFQVSVHNVTWLVPRMVGLHRAGVVGCSAGTIPCLQNHEGYLVSYFCVSIAWLGSGLSSPEIVSQTFDRRLLQRQCRCSNGACLMMQGNRNWH